MMTENHHIKEDVETPALRTCRKIVAGFFDYSVLSIIVIILLIVTLCIIAFAKSRNSQVSFIIRRAKFEVNSNDQDAEGQRKGIDVNQTTRTTIPPLPEFLGSGDDADF